VKQADEAARTGILSGIRRALAADDAARLSDAAITTAWRQLPRSYDRAQNLPTADVVHLFTERLLDYDAHVERCATVEASAVIHRLLETRNNPSMLVAPGFQPSLLPAARSFVHADGLSYSKIEAFGGVLTEATLGIAETGTVVLQSVPGQGSRAMTLLPDYHLCVLREADIVQRVSEAFAKLQATATLPTTFISGPSATADIEMTRIKGVHGPRFLDVILVH
jgi:L-lactate dehydrogenase complex protein LldG